MSVTEEYLRERILLLEDRVTLLEDVIGNMNVWLQRMNLRIANMERATTPVGPSIPPTWLVTSQATEGLLMQLQGDENGQRGSG